MLLVGPYLLLSKIECLLRVCRIYVVSLSCGGDVVAMYRSYIRRVCIVQCNVLSLYAFDMSLSSCVM